MHIAASKLDAGMLRGDVNKGIANSNPDFDKARPRSSINILCEEGARVCEHRREDARTYFERAAIEHHLLGESTSEIARATDHTPRSVERYIKRFEQVRELTSYLDKDPDATVIARILGCSEHLVRAYLELIPFERPAAAATAKRRGRRAANGRVKR